MPFLVCQRLEILYHLKHASASFAEDTRQQARSVLQGQAFLVVVRVAEKNRYAIMRRILVRIQGASASAYLWICAGGCNAVDVPKDKQGGGVIFCRGPKRS